MLVQTNVVVNTAGMLDASKQQFYGSFEVNLIMKGERQYAY